MEKTKPWFDDRDPSKEFFGLLSNDEINFVKEVNVFFNENGTFTQEISRDFMVLLDFNSYENFEIQYPLFRWVCQNTEINKVNNIYWFPLGVDFYEYNPIMIAKTSVDYCYLEIISASMMQMLNGSYCAIDKNRNFLAIVVDGYYLMLALKKGIYFNYSKKIIQYMNNWSKLRELSDVVVLPTLEKVRHYYNNIDLLNANNILSQRI